MTARLPDEAFFQRAEDNGWTLVQVRYSRRGGDASYHIVNNAAQLAELVCKLPPVSAVAIMGVGNHLEWEDHVYTPTADGECKPGAY